MIEQEKTVVLNDVIEYHFKNVTLPLVDIRKEAAKAYAKQWVDEAAEIAMMQTEKGLPVGDAIYALKNQINEQ